MTKFDLSSSVTVPNSIFDLEDNSGKEILLNISLSVSSVNNSSSSNNSALIVAG